MASRFRIYNGPSPTTAAQVAVTTGTAIKTLLQIKGFNLFKVIAWGISFNGSAAATPIKAQLCETGTVNATVTAHVDAGCNKMDKQSAVASVAGLTLAASGTGYTASAEGTITATRMFDCQFVAPTNQYIYQFPLGQEPIIAIGDILRVMVHAGAAVDAFCWVDIET